MATSNLLETGLLKELTKASTIEASLAAAGSVTLDGVYATAADVNQADGVTSADYSALCGVATGLNAIDQKTGTLS